MFFLAGRRSVEYHFAEQGTSNSTAVFPQRLILKKPCRRERLEAIGTEGTNGDHTVEGGSRLWDVRGDRLSVSIMERAA